MFISVLFLTGCGRQEESKAVNNQSPTEQSTQTTTNSTDTDDKKDADDMDDKEKSNRTPSTAPTTTPASTTTSPTKPVDTKPQVTTTDKSYNSTFQSYKTPAGDEQVQVTATVDSKGIVKKVALAYVTNAPKSKMYQDLFTA
jgi:hypothetical protein